MSASMLAPATLYGAQDAISTSSSTLVTTELEERQESSARRLRRLQSSQSSGRPNVRTAHSSSSASTLKPRRNAYDGATSRREQSNVMSAAAWMDDDTGSGGRRLARATVFPDDHRCSDQEIDGGLCSCMRAIASGSNTSDNNSEGEPEQGELAHSIDQSSSYHRRLMSARKRKVVFDYEHAGQSNKENAIQASAAAVEGGPLSASLKDARQRKIDKRVTVVDVSSEEDGRHPINGHATHSRSSFVQQRRATSPDRTPIPMQSSPIRRPRTEARAADVASTSKPSAARKSISNMYERLLREEEKRHQEERERKEAARQRRRDEKKRRAEDSHLFARLTSSTSTANIVETSITSSEPSREESLLVPSSEMPPYTSPILAVSPPSTRDATVVLGEGHPNHSVRMRTSSHDRLHPLDATAISSSPNATRLAALRQEERSETSPTASTLGSAWSQAVNGNVSPEHASNSSPRQRQQRASGGDKTSSPRIPSPTPSSADSVLSFAFPNRLSPSTSPHLQAIQTMPSPQQSSSSPRRNGHRRGAVREGASQMLSMSARVPASDEALAAARVEETLRSPLLDARSEQEGRGVDTSLAVPSGTASTSTETRRVKFSPKPEIISTFLDVQEDDTGEEEDAEDEHNECADEERQNVLRGPNDLEHVMSVAFDDTPLMSSVRPNEQIDLDRALEGVDDSSRLSAKTGKMPLRGSPMKRTFASPRFPGSYFSPLGGGQGGVGGQLPPSSGAHRSALRGRASSPPLMGGAPSLYLSEHKGPPRSRSWNANHSLAETSSGSSADMPVVEENGALEEAAAAALAEDEDQVTEEGSNFWQAGAVAAPQQSTPPRKRITSTSRHEEKDVGVTANEADDSMHITLERLNRLLDLPAGEDKDGATESGGRLAGQHDSKQLLMAAQEVEAGLVKQSKADTYLDQEEYARRVEAARDRLTSIVKAIRSRPADCTGVSTMIAEQPTPAPVMSQRRIPWATLLCALCVVQLALVWFMITAALARSEHMYLVLHHRPGSYAIPPRSVGSLFGPILTQWGVVPDVGRLATGERERVSASWSSLLPWALAALRRRNGVGSAARTLLAKAAYSVGLYTLHVVPVGTSVPS